MRILLLSYSFPDDAAPRTARLARFLLERGHDIRVMCAETGTLGEAVAQGSFDQKRVIVAPWEAAKSARHRLSGLFSRTPNRPDTAMAWGKTAIAAARELFPVWQPDVIYAACPPHSVALIAAQIAQIANTPFVTEFSERWVGGASRVEPRGVQRWHAQKEHEVLSRAAAIVTTSPLWAERYARRYGADKVTVSMNGFDPEVWPLHAPVTQNDDQQKLHILHAGSIMPGHHDPRTLFRGLAALGQGAKDISITLIGENAEAGLVIAAEEKVHRQVECRVPASQNDLVNAFYSADALALSLSNDAREAGTVPDALFDCLAARRPIIMSGPSKGTAATIIRKRKLGTFSNEPKVIANTLAHLLAKKRAVGAVPFLPETVRENATAVAQFSSIEPMLYQIASVTPLQLAAE